ncbi:sensor histidine kinase [Chitinophaga nivalis]|uniref:Histidine kinase n=1 Tax=Chitinophaga nivalis TaxID=2991709 RepID=A0ABT3IG66_9BACT|nr:histidine kinase [Chitinophaga nivalis]MCW3482754.1 histidine kinase [Chitinophaga nivalis]
MLYISSIILLLVLSTLQQAALDFYFFKFFTPWKATELRLDKKNSGFPVTSDSLPAFQEARRQHFKMLTTGETLPATEGQLVTISATHAPSGTDSIRPLTPGPAMTGIAIATRVGEEPSFWQFLFFPEVIRRSSVFGLLMLFMSGFIKIAMQWFNSEKQREALKVEKLDAELKFLKSQINPHFLFNCLNTIYSLAHKQSKQTEHAILKLSTIMRYMIYESNEDKVMLSQELKYLQDYIDIQRLRLPDDMNIHYRLAGEATRQQIEPMLLVPFVENAFKHGISYTEKSFIDIAIAIEENTVQLKVANSHFKERVAERGGIGLQNVLKRLGMLYADEHEIDISETENQFIVNLKIVLKK